MLKMRRGRVVAAKPLEVDVDGEQRRAWADPALIGPCEVGDEVIVNVAALDLGLGSGGFDVVVANLTRGLEGGQTPPGVHVLKLNYSPLQHAVEPVEAPPDADAAPARLIPVLVLPLHGHLAPAAWAAAKQSAGLRVGFVQGAGGALPGSYSRDVKELRERNLLAAHVTVAPTYGGEAEALSLIGALHAGAGALGWDAAIVGPGPGIIGSETRFGHGGMAALDAAHAALALGLPAVLSPRLSFADPRPRHRGVSHHTRSVLDLLLAPIRVAVPKGTGGMWPEGAGPDALIGSLGGRHEAMTEQVDLDGYAEAGLPARTMGRELADDRLFFAAPLAAGQALARLAGGG